MTFTRTDSGLSNFSMFFDAELTIYTEGGDGGDNGNKNTQSSIDTIFWKSVFAKYAPNKRIKLKPMGSKTCVLPYAQKIAKGEILNSIATLDRDYDHQKGIAFQHSRIIYSHGYSWENDAWRKGIIKSYIEEIHPKGELNEVQSEILENSFKEFEKNILRLVFVDIACSINGIKGVPREKTDQYINKAGKHISISKEACNRTITKIFQEKDGKALSKVHLKICPLSDCYGKIVGSFGYFVLKELLTKTSSIQTLPKDVANQIIALHFKNARISEYEPDINSYYEKKIFDALH